MSKNVPGYVSLTVHELGIIEYVAGEEAPRPKFKSNGGGKNPRRGNGKQRRGGGGGRPDLHGMNHDPRPFRLPRPNYRPDSAPQVEPTVTPDAPPSSSES